MGKIEMNKEGDFTKQDDHLRADHGSIFGLRPIDIHRNSKAPYETATFITNCYKSLDVKAIPRN